MCRKASARPTSHGTEHSSRSIPSLAAETGVLRIATFRASLTPMMLFRYARSDRGPVNRVWPRSARVRHAARWGDRTSRSGAGTEQAAGRCTTATPHAIAIRDCLMKRHTGLASANDPVTGRRALTGCTLSTVVPTCLDHEHRVAGQCGPVEFWQFMRFSGRPPPCRAFGCADARRRPWQRRLALLIHPRRHRQGPRRAAV